MILRIIQLNNIMSEKTYISKKLQFIENKIKSLEEENEFKNWKIQGQKIVIENKKSLLGQRIRELASVRADIIQKERELKKACNEKQTENAHIPDVSLLKNEIVDLKSKLVAVGTLKEKLSEEIEYYKMKLRELSNNVDYEVLFHYKRLSESKDGNPIAQVVDKVCNGCFMHVTSQTLNALKGGQELELCPNCKRILFLREDDQI